MHGRVQREGESTRSLQRSISQHMQSVPPLATSNRTIAAAGDHSSVTSSTSTTTSTTSDSFLKDSTNSVLLPVVEGGFELSD